MHLYRKESRNPKRRLSTRSPDFLLQRFGDNILILIPFVFPACYGVSSEKIVFCDESDVAALL
jgi:hypothetical protein